MILGMAYNAFARGVVCFEVFHPVSYCGDLHVAWVLHYPCFTKTGCGSAKLRGSKLLLLVYALAFPYLCFTKTGGGST